MNGLPLSFDVGAPAPEDSLASLRRNDVPLPEARFVQTAPVALALAPSGTVEAWLGAVGLAVDRRALDGKFVAVDLDDTILHSSYTRPALVRETPPGDATVPAYHYAEMRRSLWRTVRAGRGVPAYERVDRRSHPALAAPRVLVRPNLALLSGLAWLSRQGVTLALVTASAARRVDYLRARLPVLDALFASRILTAEGLCDRAEAAAGALGSPPPGPCEPWRISADLHRRRPRSIMAKSPWAVASALDAPAYDLLVDDSVGTAALMRESGLGDRLVWVDPDTLSQEYAVSVLAEIVARLSGTRQTSAQPLPHASGAAEIPLWEAEPVLIEDPWYYPLLHVRDRMESESTSFASASGSAHSKIGSGKQYHPPDRNRSEVSSG